MINRFYRAAAAGAILASAAAPAFATEATSTLDVNATVTANCVVSTGLLDFGDVDVTSGQNVDGTGSISVTCTNGTAWSAAADAGADTGATLATRKMAAGANKLGYQLFTDNARTAIWGDGVGGTTALITATGSGSAQTKTVYGQIAAGQTGLPAGDYADTVNVTVTY
ncbi:MAG: spore coat protein [Alphaproteobacteria bacterium]|nr:spore coat protein [Alphaproteobacteria bacterium]